MSEFTNFDPTRSLEPVPLSEEVLGREHWVVTKGFEYYIGDKEDNCFIYIPKGYLTDGATAPKIFSKLIPAWGQYGAATIVHDYMCEYLSMYIGKVRIDVPRSRSDGIFFEAMGVLDVPLPKRILMYLAVRTYSIFVARDKISTWKEKRELEISLEKHFNEHGNYDYLRTKNV